MIQLVTLVASLACCEINLFYCLHQDTVMEMDFDGGADLTFMPKFSSTCNFTEAARHASTPFNPGQVCCFLVPLYFGER